MAAIHRPEVPAAIGEYALASVGSEIKAWRTRALNVLLIVVSIAATWRVGQSVLQAIREPKWWPATLPFVVGYAFLMALTLQHRLDHRIRAWGMILVGYGLSIVALAMFGMLGNSLVYLLALPLLGMFLLGPRSGLVMAAISLALFGTFAGLAYAGWLAGWLVIATNTTAISDWIGTGVMFAGMLLMTVILAWLFNRAQSQALLQVHAASSALGLAHEELQARAQDLDRYARQMEAAADIARETTSLLDRETLLQRAAAMIASRMELDVVAVYVPTRSAGQASRRGRSSEMSSALELAAAAGPRAEAAPRLAPEVVILAMRHSQTQTGESALPSVGHVPDASVDPARGEVEGRDASTLELGIPLRISGQPLAVLYVLSHRTGQKRSLGAKQEESSALQVMADQLAVAMENARLFGETRANLRELDSMYRQYTAEAWTRFTATRQQVAEFRAPLSGSQAGRGLLPEERQPAAHIAPETWQALFERVRASGQPEQIDAAGQQLLAVPVKLRDVPVGVLGFYQSAAAGRWREDQVSAIEIVAERLAVATENLRLLEESQQRAARETWIGQVGDRMQRSADVGALLEIAAQELAATLGASHTLVQLADERALLSPRDRSAASPAGKGVER